MPLAGSSAREHAALREARRRRAAICELLGRRLGEQRRARAPRPAIAALPIITVTRLEYEPRSTGVMSVSPVTQRMS